MAQEIENTGMGWLPDYPDFRDYTAEQDNVSSNLKALGQKDSVKVMLEKVGVAKKNKVGSAKPAKVSQPASTDLKAWCSPIENQGSLGSCTANAGVQTDTKSKQNITRVNNPKLIELLKQFESENVFLFPLNC